MLADTQIASALDSMVSHIAVPPVPLQSIRERTSHVTVADPRRNPLAWGAIAAAAAIAIAFAAFPASSLAVFERIVVDSYQAAYKLMDWTPPPPPPSALYKSVTTHSGTLAAAQSAATFTIVPPAGLPSDVTSEAIRTTPTLIYSKRDKTWSKGPVSVSFTFHRKGGDWFELMAEPYDPRTGPPPKYMHVAEDLPGGRVALTKHEHFSWRNGDQMMSVTEGLGITAPEIEAIRGAMHGSSVATWVPGQPDTATIVKSYTVTGP